MAMAGGISEHMLTSWSSLTIATRTFALELGLTRSGRIPSVPVMVLVDTDMLRTVVIDEIIKRGASRK